MRPFLSFILCEAWLAGCAREPAPKQATNASAPPEIASASRYAKIPQTADGIGKSYMGREIAGVMGWQGAAWLEREEREQEERGELLLKELNLQPGLQVADVGAGTGYYARRMAPLVGATGAVFARSEERRVGKEC